MATIRTGDSRMVPSRLESIQGGIVPSGSWGVKPINENLVTAGRLKLGHPLEVVFTGGAYRAGIHGLFMIPGDFSRGGRTSLCELHTQEWLSARWNKIAESIKTRHCPTQAVDVNLIKRESRCDRQIGERLSLVNRYEVYDVSVV